MHRTRATLSLLATLSALAVSLPSLSAAEGDDPGAGLENNFPRERDFDRRRVNRSQPLFFPPVPPPLDWPIFRVVSPSGRSPAPPELAAYVNEIFYPALGTRLATGTLTPSERQKLEKYRATKLALQRELRAVIDAQAAAEPDARRQALETFARKQTPALVELEKTAEDLRRDFITSATTWGARREWFLTDKERRGFSPNEIALVMRGYAFYHDALAPEQRRLLREIAMELMFAVDNVAAASKQPFLSFSPETSRIIFPDNMPAELSAKVADYQAKKAQIKKGLYDTISGYDGAVFGFIHHSLKGEASKQAAAYRELETLAEEIRRGLAAMPPPPAPKESSPLPPTLALRVANVVRDRSIARRDATQQADAILARGREVGAYFRIVYRFAEDGMLVSRLPARNANEEVTPAEGEILNRLQREMEAVAETYGRRLAELLTEQEAIRADAAAALGETRRDKIETALIIASQRASIQENEEAFRDYRLAVFEPGLSPEQRRLLFDRAVEHFDLPLPRGEMQPRVRAQSW